MISIKRIELLFYFDIMKKKFIFISLIGFFLMRTGCTKPHRVVKIVKEVTKKANKLDDVPTKKLHVKDAPTKSNTINTKEPHVIRTLCLSCNGTGKKDGIKCSSCDGDGRKIRIVRY